MRLGSAGDSPIACGGSGVCGAGLITEGPPGVFARGVLALLVATLFLLLLSARAGAAGLVVLAFHFSGLVLVWFICGGPGSGPIHERELRPANRFAIPVHEDQLFGRSMVPCGKLDKALPPDMAECMKSGRNARWVGGSGQPIRNEDPGVRNVGRDGHERTLPRLKTLPRRAVAWHWRNRGNRLARRRASFHAEPIHEIFHFLGRGFEGVPIVDVIIPRPVQLTAQVEGVRRKLVVGDTFKAMTGILPIPEQAGGSAEAQAGGSDE